MKHLKNRFVCSSKDTIDNRTGLAGGMFEFS